LLSQAIKYYSYNNSNLYYETIIYFTDDSSHNLRLFNYVKYDVERMEMMEKMSGVFLDDSASKADKASVMLPACLESIVSTLDDDQKAEYLYDITNNIITSGYNTLPEND
jgi:hypothetical protein